jgi:type I restriction enzyme R subunit
MNKQDLSERDICSKYITPAVRDVAGWQEMQISEEFTLGKIHMSGKSVQRGSKKRADYILFYKRHLPLAVIETKDNNHNVGAGMQQALGYADGLDLNNHDIVCARVIMTSCAP